MLRAFQYSDHPQGRTRLRPVAQRSALPGLIAARGIGRWRRRREKYREALTFHRIKTRARAQVSSICETIQLRNPMLQFARTLLIVSLNTNLLLCGAAAQEPKALPLPDERYKADLLLVVAHPDDEGAATPYLARALDEHKRVAVVFGTRGSSGANEAGAEQAAALG